MPHCSEDLLARLGSEKLVLWHRTNGKDVDASAYQERYRKVLRCGLSGARLIYLDTNYWVQLRDAELGLNSRDSNAAQRLLQTLRAMVRSREVICVSQFNSLLELGKQEATSLRVTARLLDELTEGISIAPMADLLAWDCGTFLASKLGIEIQEGLCVWTKVGQIHRIALPEELPGPVTKAGREVVLKATIDLLWNATFEEVFGQFLWETKRALNADIDPEVIARVEERKAKQRTENRSRENVRLTEFSQFVNQNLLPIFANQMIERERRHKLSNGLAEVKHQIQTALVAAVSDFKTRTLGKLLPSAAIQVELYALYETENRRLTTNDWTDWNHAAAALPHCDVFLTERHLANQLCQKLGADSQYACAVIGTIESAINELQRHSGRSSPGT